MGRGMGLAALGVVLGAIGAVALRQVVVSELYGVSPLDLSVFLFVTTVLFGVAAVACFLPARRAMKIDPVSLPETSGPLLHSPSKDTQGVMLADDEGGVVRVPAHTADAWP